eukprot:COSAG04_NODE_75_length_28792_cov_4.615272_16_plen_282_part_00
MMVLPACSLLNIRYMRTASLYVSHRVEKNVCCNRASPFPLAGPLPAATGIEALRVAAAYVGVVVLSFGLTASQPGAKIVANRGAFGIAVEMSLAMGNLIWDPAKTVSSALMIANWCAVRSGCVRCTGPPKPAGSEGSVPLRHGVTIAVGCSQAWSQSPPALATCWLMRPGRSRQHSFSDAHGAAPRRQRQPRAPLSARRRRRWRSRPRYSATGVARPWGNGARLLRVRRLPRTEQAALFPVCARSSSEETAPTAAPSVRAPAPALEVVVAVVRSRYEAPAG